MSAYLCILMKYHDILFYTINVHVHSKIFIHLFKGNIYEELDPFESQDQTLKHNLLSQWVHFTAGTGECKSLGIASADTGNNLAQIFRQTTHFEDNAPQFTSFISLSLSCYIHSFGKLMNLWHHFWATRKLITQSDKSNPPLTLQFLILVIPYFKYRSQYVALAEKCWL